MSNPKPRRSRIAVTPDDDVSRVRSMIAAFPPKVTTHRVPLTNLPEGLHVTPAFITVTLDRAGGLGGPCGISWAENIDADKEQPMSSSISVEANAAIDSKATFAPMSPGAPTLVQPPPDLSEPSTLLTKTSSKRREMKQQMINLKRRIPVPRIKSTSPKRDKGGAFRARLNIGTFRRLHVVNAIGRMHSGMTHTAVLPAGSCNLYLFPRIRTADEPQGMIPSVRGMAILKHILHYLGTLPLEPGQTRNPFDAPDSVGAYPVHALMVCNTPESLEVAMSLYKAVPKLLTRVHSHMDGPFGGESALHIATVNRHEDLLIQMIELATEHLEPSEARALLRSNAEGAFFELTPMRLYGGSPLSFACAFGMEKAVLSYLRTGHVSLNDRSCYDKITGFLPIHSVVASRNMDMYDFLTSELQAKHRPNVQSVTKVGRFTHLYHYSLSPLQLATQLGDHSAVRHILRKQCDVEWVWGPVTQFALDLEGVDSAGKGGGDIMELIVRTGASRQTNAMLLDSFMHGFIYRLYERKWSLYGRKLHVAKVMLDFILAGSLVSMTFLMKDDPFTFRSTAGCTASCILNLVLIGISIEEEVRTCVLFAANQQGEGDARISLTRMLGHVYRFADAHGMLVQLAAYTLTAIGAVMILCPGVLPEENMLFVTPGDGWYEYAPTYNPGYHDASGNWTLYSTTATAAVSGDRRLLKAKGGAGPSLAEIQSFSSYEIRNEGPWAVLWLVQSMAILFLMLHLAHSSFKPFQNLYILLLSIFKILQSDLTTFMIVFIWFMFTFYCCLFVLYPRSGTAALPISDQFNFHKEAIFATIDLAIGGEPFDLKLPDDAFTAMGAMQKFDAWLWIAIYYFYMVASLILLINLLIAMMSYTFDAVRQEAVLQSRLGFASLVMKLELLATAFGMKTRVGESVQGRVEADGDQVHVYRFRTCENEPESNGVEESDSQADFHIHGSDPFMPPAASTVMRVLHSVEAMKKEVMEQLSERKCACCGSRHAGDGDGEDQGQLSTPRHVHE